MKKLKWYLKWGILVLIVLLPVCALGIIRREYSETDTAARWSNDADTAQISVYISEEQNFSVLDIMKFREELKLKLKESDVHTSKNGTDTWTDCYSVKQTVQVSHAGTEAEITAYGVGGNFFLFHPFTLVSGAYFTEENLMQDLVLLDEDTAWRFFGSTDIAGMEIEINGVPHIISGVIERESGIFQKAAGNNKPAIYMSYDSLAGTEESLAITTYEVVMPNLTKDYAKKIVKEQLEISNSKCEIVECTDRYSFEALLKVMKTFGERAMQTKPIVYPFWENVARGVENLCALLLFLFLLMAGILMVYLIVRLIIFLRRNGENIQYQFQKKMQHFVAIWREVKRRIQQKTAQKKNQKDEKNVNTVIFDIGNVLAKFVPKEYLETVGIPEEKIDEVLAAVVENDIWNEYDKGEMTQKEVLLRFIQASPELELEIRQAFRNLNGIVKRFDYTDAWIHELKEKGYRVLYLSNISEKLFHECEAELDFVKQMDGGILSFEAKMIKPDAEIYEKIIAEYNLIPEQCIFIDDRNVNILAAGKAGFRTILFTSYEDVKEEMNKIL